MSGFLAFLGLALAVGLVGWAAHYHQFGDR